MSDPTSIGYVLNQRVNANNAADSATPNLKIVKIPKSLERNDRPQKLRGEITQKDNDGTINIRTDKGNITVKADQRTDIKKGDIVEIKIDKGNPPQSINIRPAPKQIPQTEIQTSQISVAHYTQITADINLPPNLSAQELINGAPIKVAVFPAQQLSTITDINSEKITTNATLISNLPLIIQSGLTTNSPLQILSTDINSSALPILSETLSATLPIDQNTEIFIFSASLQQPSTEIPLYFIAAKTVSNPAAIPIGISKTSPETPITPTLLEIKITDITQPLTEIYAPALSEKHAETYLTARESSPPSHEKAGETHAILVGFTENKHLPIIRITAPQSRADQHYTLQTPVSDIPVGTQIGLNITQSTTIAPALNAPLTAPLPSLSSASFFTPEIWPIMQEIQTTLTQINPQTATAFSNIIPNAAAPAQIHTSALFFMAALRSGDLQSWVGDKAIETLKRAGKGDLINRLGSEMSSLARLSSEPAPQEWRTLSLPMAWQNDIHKLVMHYRREDESGSDSEENGTGTKTRFIMDVKLSQMGKVQLDGLFIGNPEGVGRLDLILRTEQGFSQAMKQDMRVAYKNALEDTNFTGELSFQGQIDGWVNITPDVEAAFVEDV
ncbi:MAG: hypothetical protein COB14_05950 [Alphaproteobacteria bacterium]|nr:MAG: hypothetical protein COB14_05950 [Alphaproteobacteria bacterium]